jgi:hypothetical protein
MAAPRCLDDPATIFTRKMCVHAVSKNLKATIKLLEKDEQRCEKPPCRTLKTSHTLKLTGIVSNNPCDSKFGKILTGSILVEKLSSAFDQDGTQRGFHAGDFEWKTASFLIRGRLSGVTNAGTHRKPIFKDCQPCDARGFMEGRICGAVVETTKEELTDCQIIGTYRLSFPPSETGGNGSGSGTIEAVLVCPCK